MRLLMAGFKIQGKEEVVNNKRNNGLNKKLYNICAKLIFSTEI